MKSDVSNIVVATPSLKTAPIAWQVMAGTAPAKLLPGFKNGLADFLAGE